MAYNELKLQFYKVLLLSVKRKSTKRVYNNAKPILLLTIFDEIEKKEICNNQIHFESNLKKKYEEKCKTYEIITPFIYPFYYLQNDGFFKFVTTNNSIIFPHTPSAKFFHDNVRYCTLDNALWDLLQDVESRTILREAIINHFFNSVKNK